MTHTRSGGLTLIELLIVVAIIAILAAVLVPNLITARARAFDAATQTCLKEIATRQEGLATESPFAYVSGLDPTGFASCSSVTVVEVSVTDTTYDFTGLHDRGSQTYRVTEGTPVLPVP